MDLPATSLFQHRVGTSLHQLGLRRLHLRQRRAQILSLSPGNLRDCRTGCEKKRRQHQWRGRHRSEVIENHGKSPRRRERVGEEHRAARSTAECRADVSDRAIQHAER